MSTTPSPDPQALAAELVAELEAAGTVERRRQGDGYHPTALRLLGVANPELHRIVRAVHARLKRQPPAEVLALAEALVAEGSFEARHLAYELLFKRKDALDALDRPRIERLGRGNDNWVSTDTFGVTVPGPAWARGRLADADLADWARSEDRWWRRTALVATVALNLKSRGGRGDAARTLPICEALLDDRDDMVVKAVSWALRSLVSWDREAVARFAETHEARLAARVRRELRTKLTTGRKSG